MDGLGVARAWGHRAVTPADSTRGKVLLFVALLDVTLQVLFKWNLIVDLFILVLALLLLALAANRLMILILSRRAGASANIAAQSGG